MLAELPCSMRTLDTMTLAMTMKTTMGLSWLMGLIPLKSLSMKVIGGRLRCDGASTKLCRCVEWCEDGVYGTSWIVLYRKICPQWCWLHLWFVVLVEVVACASATTVSIYLDLLLCLFFFFFFFASWLLCCSSWCPSGLTPTWWLSHLLTN